MENNPYDPTHLGISYLHRGFPDDTYPAHDYLDEILNFMYQHLKAGEIFFVHCSMGISRSGYIIVAWLLKEILTLSWMDTISYVNKSKFIAPAIGILSLIISKVWRKIEEFIKQYKISI